MTCHSIPPICVSSVGSCRFNYITFQRLLNLAAHSPFCDVFTALSRSIYLSVGIYIYILSIAQLNTNLGDTFRTKEKTVESKSSATGKTFRFSKAISCTNIVAMWNGGNNFSYRWILNEDQPDSSKSQKNTKIDYKLFSFCSLFTYSFTQASSLSSTQLTQWRWHQIIIKYNPYHLRGKLSVCTTDAAAAATPLTKVII